MGELDRLLQPLSSVVAKHDKLQSKIDSKVESVVATTPGVAPGNGKTESSRSARCHGFRAQDWQQARHDRFSSSQILLALHC